MGVNYIPARDAEFDGWFANLVTYVEAHTTAPTDAVQSAWPDVPPTAVVALRTRLEAWHAAFDATTKPHAKPVTDLKNEARKEAEAVIRPFVNQYLRFAPVTDEDRDEMRIHNRDTTNTPVPVPTTRPTITDLKALGGFQVRVAFRDETTPDSRAVPYGDNGGLIFYAWTDKHVTDYAELTTTALMTKSPFTLTLQPEAEGKRFTCALRWQNEKGERGPWGEMETTIVV
jgi:hypothetical protein